MPRPNVTPNTPLPMTTGTFVHGTELEIEVPSTAQSPNRPISSALVLRRRSQCRHRWPSIAIHLANVNIPQSRRKRRCQRHRSLTLPDHCRLPNDIDYEHAIRFRWPDRQRHFRHRPISASKPLRPRTSPRTNHRSRNQPQPPPIPVTLTTTTKFSFDTAPIDREGQPPLTIWQPMRSCPTSRSVTNGCGSEKLDIENLDRIESNGVPMAVFRACDSPGLL